jgi:hypothetical protein
MKEKKKNETPTGTRLILHGLCRGQVLLDNVPSKYITIFSAGALHLKRKYL